MEPTADAVSSAKFQKDFQPSPLKKVLVKSEAVLLGTNPLFPAA